MDLNSVKNNFSHFIKDTKHKRTIKKAIEGDKVTKLNNFRIMRLIWIVLKTAWIVIVITNCIILVNVKIERKER